MTARAALIVADLRCLVAAALALAAGGVAFVLLALLALVAPGVSGTWLVLPSAVMVLGVVLAGGWLVFGGGVQRPGPAPAAEAERAWNLVER